MVLVCVFGKDISRFRDDDAQEGSIFVPRVDLWHCPLHTNQYSKDKADNFIEFKTCHFVLKACSRKKENF